ncbi:MAG: hypothetical protein K6G42_10000 [Lachnospiraceae bacterium]|nr:hypothetical protein [Lachnospiraceae bacterium]
MKLRITIIALLLALAVSGCGNSAATQDSASSTDPTEITGNTEEGEKETSANEDNTSSDEPTELVWWVYSATGDIPDDQEEVLAKANEISKEKIGVTVKMINKTAEQFDLDLQTGEYYDMTFSCDWCNDFDRNAGNGYYYDLTDMVEKDAPDLYKAVPQKSSA